MDEPMVPDSAEQLRERLKNIREARRQRQANQRTSPTRRKLLTALERAAVLEKTGRRCHICGGEVSTQWQADHVLARSSGGLHSAENYLPAHTLCNNYRWDYDAEEFQWVLKIGVWARKQMEDSSRLGSDMLKAFYKYEVQRHRRGRGKEQDK
jgi:5-methylcytosine-specific restriction endonuclease McrA